MRITCPHCGQAHTLVRFGVLMRPSWVRIVDAISRAGTGGISRPDLTAMIYGDRSVSANVMSVHVNHINEALLSTDFRIRGGKAGYRIVRVASEAA